MVLSSLIGMPQAGGGGASTSSGITDLDRISETTTSRDMADSDSGYVIQCSNASAITVTFPDTVTAGSWGFIERLSGAGVISWAASGSMVVTPSADSAGHTGSGDAPSVIYWFCDATNSVIVGGDTGPTDGPLDLLKLDDLEAPDDNTDLNATTSAHGLLPKLGGGTTNFLRADGSWAAPAGGSPGGSTGQLQYNNAGAFGGIAGTSWASNQLLMTAQAAATTPLAVRAAASHTANIQEWQNSAGTVQCAVDTSTNGTFRSRGGFKDYGGLRLGGMDFASGYVHLYSYNGNRAIAVQNDGKVAIINALAFGPNYYTNDALFLRIAAGIVGIRGATSSAGGALSFIEQTAPSAPATNGVYIYAEDNGAGKTRLMALFASGAAQQIAIEP